MSARNDRLVRWKRERDTNPGPLVAAGRLTHTFLHEDLQLVRGDRRPVAALQFFEQALGQNAVPVVLRNGTVLPGSTDHGLATDALDVEIQRGP